MSELKAEWVKGSLQRYMQENFEASKKRTLISEEAYRDYYKAIKPGESFKKMLLEQYTEKALEIALAKDIPPYNREGGRDRPDDISLTLEGIDLRWDADHPNDTIDLEVTFEELCKE